MAAGLTAPQAARILVVDSPTMCREGLSSLLAQAGFDVVASTSDTREALECATRLAPIIATVNVRLPSSNGFELAMQIRRFSPHTKVVLLSAQEDPSHVLQAIRCGASAYLLKSALFSSLLKALQLVLDGDTVLDLKANADLRTVVDGSYVGASTSTLHPREREILMQVAQGRSNKEVAEIIGLSERTVQSHLVNLFRRWGVSTRTAAFLYALKTGVLSLEDLR